MIVMYANIVKPLQQELQVFLQPLETPKKKWECVSIDFITSLTPPKVGIMQYWYVWIK